MFPAPLTVFPGVHIRDEGEVIRNGLNIYPLRRWKWSRGFVLKLGRLRYYCRYSVYQRRLLHGWERR